MCTASNKHMNINTDDLKWILDRNTEFIRDADNKGAILLAVTAVIGTILFSSDKFSNFAQEIISNNDSLGILLLIAMLFFAMLCISFACISIFPRTKSSEKSHIYFGDICDYNDADDYKSAIKDKSFSFENDLFSQIMNISKICTRKMKWQARSYIALIALLATLIFFIGRVMCTKP